MDYLEIECILSPPSDERREILIARLAGEGCPGFVETATGCIAYFPEGYLPAETLAHLLQDLQQSMGTVQFRMQLLREKNWNEEWERNFPPVLIDDRCLIRAPFHPSRGNYPYEIILEPKMAFGTGHHPSTRLMVRSMLTLALAGTRVLDAGCGTGILSILAARMGASSVVALDNHPYAVENTRENSKVNGISIITVLEGEAGTLKEKTGFDLVLANINLPVILDEMASFCSLLRVQGTLVLGGFLTSDRDKVAARAAALPLLPAGSYTDEEWTCLLYRKRETMEVPERT